MLKNLLVSQAPKAEVWRHFLAAFNIGTTLPGGNKSEENMGKKF